MNIRKYKGKKSLVLMLVISLLIGQFASVPSVNAMENEQQEETASSGEASDTSGEASDTSGEASDTSGEASDTSGEVSDTSGEASDTSGEVSDTSGEASDASDLANLRLVFTSDIHGQVTTEDYENGTKFTTGGLSRAATLIQEAKNEAGEENTLLFNLGDNMFDYTTDYIYNYDASKQQPIYTALGMLGFDAITLGNHDFEYTLPYIQQQLDGAGLSDKVVLSNVRDVNTGDTVWAENKIIEKQLTTASGSKMTVKVGLIGETIPTLSKKRTNYKGVLQTEDIVENVTKEVAVLQEQGADIIVVIAHSGIGVENPAKNAQSVGYALTKISGVDAVLCGHAHKDFPLASGTKYDYLPGVDMATGLVNGKNLIQVANRGASVGVADLTLSDDDNKITIVERSSSLRKVTAETEVNQEINNCMGDWTKTFLADCSEILCDIDKSTELQDYFGTQEDTDVMQLMNNIKISYGLNYVNNTATEYKNYPLIAASSYLKYGSGDAKDYIDVSGEFKRSNVYDLVTYKTSLYLYQMTGSQVREWLEWSASCYETVGSNLLSASDFQNYTLSKPLQYAVQQDYQEDWKNFYVFDGIEYEIDPSAAPRYDANGEKINDTWRITSLTRNGVEISDSEIFVVVTNQLPDNVLFQEIGTERIVNAGSDKCRSYVAEYMEKIALTGNLKPMKDNNWRVKYSTKYNYVLRSSEKAEKIMQKRDWITSTLGADDGYNYYLAESDKITSEDTSGPGLNAIILDENVTNKKGTIVVQATDASGVASIKYTVGKYGVSNEIWNSATKINGTSFLYSENATYSIMAEDTKGNRSVYYIKTTNINRNVLETPEVSTYTNRKSKIQGKAEANAKIYFQIENGSTYSTTVKVNGTFSYALPAQKAGKKIFVYVVDSKGRTSARATVTVARTGPNKPTLNNTLKTNTRTVSGKLNDTYVYPMILVNDTTLYVPDQHTAALYEKSSFYDAGYKVEVTEMEITSAGKFSFVLPDYLDASATVKLRTVDALSRCSLQTKVGVKQALPRTPQVAGVSNLTKKVKVYTKELCTRASVKINSKKYSSDSAVYSSEKGYCYTVKIPRTDSTSVLKVYLTNTVGNSSSVKIRPIEKAPNKPKLDTIKANQKKITGTVDVIGSSETNTVKNTGTKVYIFVRGKKCAATIKQDGSFVVKFKKLKLRKKDKVVCIAKNNNGNSLKRVVYVK